MNLITGILIYNVDDFLLYLNKKNIKFNKIIQIISNINFIIKKKKNDVQVKFIVLNNNSLI